MTTLVSYRISGRSKLTAPHVAISLPGCGSISTPLSSIRVQPAPRLSLRNALNNWPDHHFVCLENPRRHIDSLQITFKPNLRRIPTFNFQPIYTSFHAKTAVKIPLFSAPALSDWTRWGIRLAQKTTRNPGYVFLFFLTNVLFNNEFNYFSFFFICTISIITQGNLYLTINGSCLSH